MILLLGLNLNPPTDSWFSFIKLEKKIYMTRNNCECLCCKFDSCLSHRKQLPEITYFRVFTSRKGVNHFLKREERKKSASFSIKEYKEKEYRPILRQKAWGA